MPELPEAQTIADQLHRRLKGRRLGAVRLHRPDIIRTRHIDMENLLLARRVSRVYRRAKRVVVELDPPARLIFGLGMTGRLSVVRAGEQVEKHTHLRIDIPSLHAELRFRDPRRFGGIWLQCPDDNHVQSDPLATFGIEPLTCRPNQFKQLLARNRQIKALLMDQRAIAGLGNIYCDEALYFARIHPLTRASRLNAAQSALLLRSIKKVLRQAIKSKGSTLLDYRDVDGGEGGFQNQHRVYAREHLPCKTCATPILRIQAAGRSTHICPKCQKR